MARAIASKTPTTRAADRDTIQIAPHFVAPLAVCTVTLCNATVKIVVSRREICNAPLGEPARATHHERMTTKWFSGFCAAAFASAVLLAGCSIDRERKMFPGGGSPGGSVGTSGFDDGQGGSGSPSGDGSVATADGGSGDNTPPPNTDLGGANSLIDMAPPTISFDMASGPQRDLGPEFIDFDLGGF